jgi:hypothetical protein
MTLINALAELKAKGTEKVTGFGNGQADINDVIQNAQACHDDAVKFSAMGIQTWQYSIDHEDDNFMIETPDGHFIIATTYGTADGKPFDMATYSNYDTEDEMRAAFDEWKINKQANKMADEMIKERPGELPRAAWILIARSELKAAYKAADEAFKREFGEKE